MESGRLVKTCSFDGCDRKSSTRGFCKTHYTRLMRHGDPSVVKVTVGCRVPDCDRRHKGHGYCQGHLEKLRRAGTVDGVNKFYGHKGCKFEQCDRKHHSLGLCGRHYGLLYGYSLTFERYNEMLDSQGGRCAICKERFVSTPHIDHDHKCCEGKTSCGGCVRGLLCFKCNNGLGSFEDKIESLENAVDYLRKAEEW